MRRLGVPFNDFSSALFVGHNAIASLRDLRNKRLRPVQDVEYRHAETLLRCIEQRSGSECFRAW
jgi:hypothetical protein